MSPNDALSDIISSHTHLYAFNLFEKHTITSSLSPFFCHKVPYSGINPLIIITVYISFLFHIQYLILTVITLDIA